MATYGDAAHVGKGIWELKAAKKGKVHKSPWQNGPSYCTLGGPRITFWLEPQRSDQRRATHCTLSLRHAAAACRLVLQVLRPPEDLPGSRVTRQSRHASFGASTDKLLTLFCPWALLLARTASLQQTRGSAEGAKPASPIGPMGGACRSHKGTLSGSAQSPSANERPALAPLVQSHCALSFIDWPS